MSENCVVPGCHRKTGNNRQSLCKYHYRMAELYWLDSHTGEVDSAS